MKERLNADTARVMFFYLGRRGAMSRFALEAMRVARTLTDVEATLFVSRQNESFAAMAGFGEHCVGVDTFQRSSGALLAAWRIPLLRKTLTTEIRDRRVSAVIELMPHVWSPVLVSAIRSGGARYVTTVHDASAHPGDTTALVNSILNMAVVRADRVITLSETVTAQLRAGGRVSSDRIVTLFQPNLSYGPPPVRQPREPDAPLRLLFFGRIMPYKGLKLFVDAVEGLRRGGIPVEAGVFGEGALGAEGARLKALGAKIVNRWLSDEEIASILDRHDVMVVSHVEASQSGVIATAFGAGVPVIATPVGALPEQVEHGVTGLVADAVSGEALAAAITQLALDHALYSDLCEGLWARRDLRSMQRFVRECVRLAHE
jgi:glycosyltransferase involved in cell wall biosynthesis